MFSCARATRVAILARTCLRTLAQVADLLAQLRVQAGFALAQVGEGTLALLEEVAVGARAGEETARVSTIDLRHARARRLEEAPIVTDHDHGRAQRAQGLLEPLDPGEVEVVGRLVEQEQIGAGRDLGRERKPALPAAREFAHLAVPVGKPRLAEASAVRRLRRTDPAVDQARARASPGAPA